MEFVNYLKKELAESTVKRYSREIMIFKNHLKSKKIDPEKASYLQIMDFISAQRKTNRRMNCSLQAIKKFYSFLIEKGIRKDHPAQTIRLKDRRTRDIQLQDLFKSEELESLLNRKERYPILKNRNQIIVSLLIYQALTNGDIRRLELRDIDLEKTSIYIKAGAKTNSRTLRLKANQIMLLYHYINQDRPRLLKEETEILLIGKLGKAITTDGIAYLLETFKESFKGRKLNAQTVRQSVITNLLKQGKELRVVQVFAGHKYPSTTEKYQQSKMEELRQAVMKYHPLG